MRPHAHCASDWTWQSPAACKHVSGGGTCASMKLSSGTAGRSACWAACHSWSRTCLLLQAAAGVALRRRARACAACGRPGQGGRRVVLVADGQVPGQDSQLPRGRADRGRDRDRGDRVHAEMVISRATTGSRSASAASSLLTAVNSAEWKSSWRKQRLHGGLLVGGQVLAGQPVPAGHPEPARLPAGPTRGYRSRSRAPGS
jgi:hypothetical protein